MSTRGYCLILVASLFILADILSSNCSHGYIQEKLERCCLSDTHSPSNQTDCFKLVDMELNKQNFTRSKTFRYVRKLWQFVSIATKRYQNMGDKSVCSWQVNASRPVLATRNVLVFNKPALTTPTTDVINGPSSESNVLTRVELLVPFYHVRSAHSCPRKLKDMRSMTVTYDGETFSPEEGTVPFRNVLVFRLPHTSEDNEEISGEKMITLNTDADFKYFYPNGSILLKYFNMNDTITEEIREMAVTRLHKRMQKTSRNKKDSTSDLREDSIYPHERIRRSSLPPMPSKLCQRRNYFLHLRNDLNIWNVVSPERINIGTCSGMCNTIDLLKSDKYSTGRSVILNLIKGSTIKCQSPPESSCVPDKMNANSILTLDHGNGDTQIQIIPSMHIASCRCV